MPRFQATFIDSNMLIGASEEASNYSDTVIPAASIRSSWPWKPPAVPRRSSEWTEKLTGDLVRTIA